MRLVGSYEDPKDFTQMDTAKAVVSRLYALNNKLRCIRQHSRSALSEQQSTLSSRAQ